MWYCSLLLLILVYFNFAKTESLVGVVGGHDAKSDEFPYMVSIQNNNQHFCGGSIISDEWILTAAHCFAKNANPYGLTILTGTIDLNSGGKRYAIKRIIRHAHYANFTNDIALLNVNRTIEFDSNTEKINLPTQDTPAGTKVVLTGWGLTHFRPNVFTNTLKAIELVTISTEECQKYYGKSNVPDEDICTLTKEGEGSCEGDSGGPLVDPKLNRQVGIVSGGIPCAMDTPDIYTDVYKYLKWINKKMQITHSYGRPRSN